MSPLTLDLTQFPPCQRWENGRASSHTRAIDKSEVPEEAQGNALSDGTNGARQALTAGNRTRLDVDYAASCSLGGGFFFRPK